MKTQKKLARCNAPVVFSMDEINKKRKKMFAVDFAPFSSTNELDNETPRRLVPPPPLGRHIAQPASPPRCDRDAEHFAGEGTAPSDLAVTATGDQDTTSQTTFLKLAGYMDTSQPGYTTSQAIAYAIEDWMRITHKVMDYQYVNDINTYVKTVQEEERDRLTTQYHSITNDVMKTKTVYTHTQRDAMMLYSRIRVILHSMLFISAFAFLYANRTFFGAAAYIMLIILCVSFGIYIIMHVKISGSRSYDDWDRVRFNDEAVAATALAPPVTGDAAGGQCQSASVNVGLNSLAS